MAARNGHGSSTVVFSVVQSCFAAKRGIAIFPEYVIIYVTYGKNDLKKYGTA